jgi:hypothetical protein
VRNLSDELFAIRGLIKNGTSGRSLVERPVDLLEQAIALGKRKRASAKFC